MADPAGRPGERHRVRIVLDGIRPRRSDVRPGPVQNDGSRRGACQHVQHGPLLRQSAGGHHERSTDRDADQFGKCAAEHRRHGAECGLPASRQHLWRWNAARRRRLQRRDQVRSERSRNPDRRLVHQHRCGERPAEDRSDGDRGFSRGRGCDAAGGPVRVAVRRGDGCQPGDTAVGRIQRSDRPGVAHGQHLRAAQRDQRRGARDDQLQRQRQHRDADSLRGACPGDDLQSDRHGRRRGREGPGRQSHGE